MPGAVPDVALLPTAPLPPPPPPAWSKPPVPPLLPCDGDVLGVLPAPPAYEPETEVPFPPPPEPPDAGWVVVYLPPLPPPEDVYGSEAAYSDIEGKEYELGGSDNKAQQKLKVHSRGRKAKDGMTVVVKIL